MTEDRRYADEEIQAIFGAAAEASEISDQPRPTAGGLTLAELQQIGQEVGIPAERITAAARAIDQRRAVVVPRRTYLGMPIGVGRTIELARAPTDREWGLLVSEFRTTFGAHGRVESEGSLRAWTNGNLRACVEPTDTGYCLRLSTLKGSALPTLLAAGGAVLYGLLMFGILLLSGKIPEGLAAPVLLVALGVTAAGFLVRRLPAWAREREEQMAHIATRAHALIGSGAPDPG